MSTDYSTLIGLVEQYSPSGDEHGAVEWLVKHMTSLGFGEAFVDGAGNAVGVMGKGSKQVVLLGHIDTVPGEIPVRVENDLLFGRGAVDAKGPLASFVDTVAQIGIVEGWQFVVVGAVEEERSSLGARFVVDQYHPDYAVIGEPNNWDRVALGYKGSAWANVIVRKEQAHSASGEQTAAEAAVEAWLVVKAFADDFNLEKTRAFDKILPTLQSIESEQNEFEQWAILRIGVRLPLDVTPDEWYLKLREISQGAEIERVGFSIPAWECEKNSQLVRSFLYGIRQEGGKPRFVYKTGTADLNVVAPIWRCPAVVYGSGNSALDHTPNEHIALDEYRISVDVLKHALQRLVKVE